MFSSVTKALQLTKPQWQEYIFPSHYSKQQALNLLKEIGLQILFVIIFAFVYYYLYHFSRNWYTHKYWSTWFLPAGWQLGCMLLLPYRYWPSLFMSSVFANWVITINYGNQPNTELFHILSKTPYKLIVALAVWPIKKWFSGKFLTHFRGVLAFLACASIVQFIMGVTLTFTSRFYASIPEERKFEIMLSFLIGGLIGNLFVASSMLAIKQLWQERKSIDWQQVISCFSSLILLGVIAVYLYTIQPHTLYLLRVLAFVPIIWFAAKSGWVGGWSSSLVAMALIAVSVYDLPETALVIEAQFYVVAIGVSGLLLGSLTHEHRKLNLSLSKQNDELLQTSIKNQQLADKLVSIQESERLKLSNELHDEVGQTITALKMELKVLEFKGEVAPDSLKRLTDGADQIYDSIYHVMNWLRPRILNDLGLRESLSGGYFSQKLNQAGIDYHCSITGDLEKLGDKQAITIFRVAQECVNNAIKHSQASNLTLLLNINEQRLTLTISDDGVGSKGSTSKGNSQGGFGLTGIEERVIALNGHFHVERETEKFGVEVTIPLSNLS